MDDKIIDIEDIQRFSLDIHDPEAQQDISYPVKVEKDEIYYGPNEEGVIEDYLGYLLYGIK